MIAHGSSLIDLRNNRIQESGDKIQKGGVASGSVANRRFFHRPLRSRRRGRKGFVGLISEREIKRQNTGKAEARRLRTGYRLLAVG